MLNILTCGISQIIARDIKRIKKYVKMQYFKPLMILSAKMQL